MCFFFGGGRGLVRAQRPRWGCSRTRRRQGVLWVDARKRVYRRGNDWMNCFGRTVFMPQRLPLLSGFFSIYFSYFAPEKPLVKPEIFQLVFKREGRKKKIYIYIITSIYILPGTLPYTTCLMIFSLGVYRPRRCTTAAGWWCSFASQVSMWPSQWREGRIPWGDEGHLRKGRTVFCCMAVIGAPGIIYIYINITLMVHKWWLV